MIVIAGTIRIRPDRRDDAIRVAVEMAGATCAEPGCVSYRFFADLVDPTLFFLFEEWESEDALTRHFASDHVKAFQRRIPDLVGGPAAIKRYAVTSAAPM
jgi:quinol monooxygenase YgiN